MNTALSVRQNTGFKSIPLREVVCTILTVRKIWQTKKLVYERTHTVHTVWCVILQVLGARSGVAKFQAFWEMTLWRLANMCRRFEVITIGLDCLTLKFNTLRPFQTSATRRSVPEHLILHSFRMPEGFSSVILIPNRNRSKTEWWTAQKVHSISPLIGGIRYRSLKSQRRRASQEFALNLWRRNYFFLIFAHPVYKCE